MQRRIPRYFLKALHRLSTDKRYLPNKDSIREKLIGLRGEPYKNSDAEIGELLADANNRRLIAKLDKALRQYMNGIIVDEQLADHFPDRYAERTQICQNLSSLLRSHCHVKKSRSLST
jgi:hypothetical protein